MYSLRHNSGISKRKVGTTAGRTVYGWGFKMTTLRLRSIWESATEDKDGVGWNGYGQEDQKRALRSRPSWEVVTMTLVYNEEGVEILGMIEELRTMGRLEDLEEID